MGPGEPDHASVELEFVAFLCQREAESWDCRDPDSALQSLAQQSAFLNSHLGLWLGLFARQVAADACVVPAGRREGTDEPFYGLVVDACFALVHHDRDLTELLLDQIPQVRRDRGTRTLASGTSLIDGPT